MKKHEETGILMFENYDEEEAFLKQEGVILIILMEKEKPFFHW